MAEAHKLGGTLLKVESKSQQDWLTTSILKKICGSELSEEKEFCYFTTEQNHQRWPP